MDNEVKTDLNTSETTARPSVDGAENFDREQKKRTRRVIGITALTLVGVLLLGELLGFRFGERTAACNYGAFEHWYDRHEKFPDIYPCGGLIIQTDDFDFLYSYVHDREGNPAGIDDVNAVRRYGFVYRRAKCTSYDILYDDNGEAAFILKTYRKRDRNYCFIVFLTGQIELVENGVLSVEFMHACEHITVNGEPVDLYLWSYFEYEGEIDSIVLEDGTTVHPATCKREEVRV